MCHFRGIFRVVDEKLRMNSWSIDQFGGRIDGDSLKSVARSG